MPLVYWSRLVAGALFAESGKKRTVRHSHASPRKPSFVGSAAKLFQPNYFLDVFYLCKLYNNVNLSAVILREEVFSGWRISRTKEKK